MRTTVRLDDELMQPLKARAREEQVSLTRMINSAIRSGLQADAGHRHAKRVYRERAQSMGAPSLKIDKALALAATLEDEHFVRDLVARKRRSSI